MSANPLVESTFPKSVSIQVPSWKRGGFYPFQGNVTGSIQTISNGLAAFTPEQPLILRGGRINLLVTTALAASTDGILGVYDGNHGGLLTTLVAHAATAPVGTLLASQLEFELREGQRITGPIYIAGTVALGAGVVLASGQLYGFYGDG